jgi:hypothetical protein
MKKIIILMAAVALAFMAMPALALTNIVVNGDFNTGNLSGWTNGVEGHASFQNGIYYNYAYTPYTTAEAAMYQICDASTGGGWITGGTAETYNFSFWYARGESSNISEYGIWYSTNATAPVFDGPDGTNSGWTLISQSSLSVSGFTPFSLSGTLEGIQPQWFAVAFEGSTSSDYVYAAVFDNVSLTTECSGPTVPVPPSALLLSSGLLGLVGWQRLRKG